MIFFKSCPRCQGDVHLEADQYGSYKECFQCGYLVDLEQSKMVLEVPASPRSKNEEAYVTKGDYLSYA